MKVFGLTGGIASGKSTVSKILKDDYHFKIVDADEVSRNISKEPKVLSAIEEEFGNDVFDEKHHLDRKTLAKKISEDLEAKKTLDGIMHPIIEELVCDQIENHRQNGEKIIIYDCPLLFETDNDRFTDEVLLVVTDEKIKIERLMKRDHIDENFAKCRIAIQMSDEEKMKRADYLLYNNDTMDTLKMNLEKIVSKWISNQFK